MLLDLGLAAMVPRDQRRVGQVAVPDEGGLMVASEVTPGDDKAGHGMARGHQPLTAGRPSAIVREHGCFSKSRGQTVARGPGDHEFPGPHFHARGHGGRDIPVTMIKSDL